ILKARAARTEKVKQAEADRVTFLVHSQARVQLGFETEWRMFCTALDAVCDRQPPEVGEQDYLRRRQQAGMLQASLTDFRLFWDALGRALSGRDLMLIDADRVPGRRHLMLFDPQQFRVPVPMLMPQDRNPPPRAPLPGGVEEGP